MPHDVFISYASPDVAVVQRLHAHLENSGVSCWIAPRDIPGGTSYGGAIIRAIKSSRVLVLLLSSHSNASRHVLTEVERAMHQHGNILTVRIENVQVSDDMDYFLSTRQWIDALDDSLDVRLDRVTQDVQRILQTSGAELSLQGVAASKNQTSRPLDESRAKNKAPASVDSVPHLVSVNAPKEIVKAWKQLEKALIRGSRKAEVMVGTGVPGAKWEIVQWRSKEEIWTLCGTEGEYGYVWLGTQNPNVFGRLSVECEFVIPLHGFNDPALFDDGGLFVRDANKGLFLAHTGEIGGGELSVTKAFTDAHPGPWHAVQGEDGDSNAENSVLLISALDDPELPAHMATFAREVVAFFRERDIGPWGPPAPGRIEEYNREELLEVLWQSIDFSWQEREDAVRLATRALGFERTGPTIQQAFKSVINSGVRRKILETQGTQIRKLKA